MNEWMNEWMFNDTPTQKKPRSAIGCQKKVYMQQVSSTPLKQNSAKTHKQLRVSGRETTGTHLSKTIIIDRI